jgi:hypothetical protein
MGEEAAANNSVVWVVQLEEEGLTRTQGSKLESPTRLPEIDFIEDLAAREEPVPIDIRETDVKAHYLNLSGESRR